MINVTDLMMRDAVHQAETRPVKHNPISASTRIKATFLVRLDRVLGVPKVRDQCVAKSAKIEII